MPAKATVTDEVTAEVDQHEVEELDEWTCWFRERCLDFFGWSLGLAADFDPRPWRWRLYAQWLRCRRDRPRGVLPWLGSFASLTICVGPVSASVSALRTRREAGE